MNNQGHKLIQTLVKYRNNQKLPMVWVVKVKSYEPSLRARLSASMITKQLIKKCWDLLAQKFEISKQYFQHCFIIIIYYKMFREMCAP